MVKTSPYTDALLANHELGTTFETYAELVDDLIYYLQHAKIENQQVLAETLHRVSAASFGQRIVEFYQDVQLTYEEAQDSAGISN